MKLPGFVLVALLLVFSSQICLAQTKTNSSVLPGSSPSAKSSPAYAEVILRKTELLSEIESQLVEYKEEFPKIKEMRFEAGLLQKEMDKLLAVGGADFSKLTAALGKLMVRKCALATDLWVLQQEFNDQHSDVKRAKRKLEIFDSAIND